MQLSLRTASYRIRGLVTLGVVVLAGGVILACGSASANTGTTTGGGSNSNNSSKKHFKGGEQVKIGASFVVTVNSVKTSHGDDISQTKTRNNFLVVDVLLNNVFF